MKLLQDKSFKLGIDFALVSATITTIGLMIGLNATISNAMVLIGGVLTIAIADSLSDSLGIHISQESKFDGTEKEANKAMLGALIGKFLFTMIFVIPLLLFEINTAILVNICIGIGTIIFLSYNIAIAKKEKVLRPIIEHLGIMAIVIFATQFIGNLIKYIFI